MAEEHLKEFTIDRSKWACQSNNQVRGAVRSYLEDTEGFKCCLGFYVEACGMKTKSDNGSLFGLPWVISVKTPAFDGESFVEPAIDPLVNINDYTDDDREREEGITKLFADKGVKVNFVGEYLK